MSEYELTLELPAISEAVEDRIVEATDATIAEHFGVTTATILVDAPDAIAAAREAMEVLSRAGAAPVRLVDDLVTRSQIADRANVSRQAVTNWISGARQADAEFPKPFVLTGGGLWRWEEVLKTLRSIGVSVDDDVDYPSRREAQLIGGLIASRQFTLETSVAVTAYAERVEMTSRSHQPAFLVGAPGSAKVDFARAA